VVALSDDVVGLGATMDIDALNRLLREPAVINVVSLRLDPTLSDQAMRSLTEAPGVATTSLKRVWIASFNEKIVSMIYGTATILIAAGVVYNAARISLQERAWELASLRILGFGQAEVATILLSELALLILAAQPIGVVLSLRLVSFLMTLSPNESVHIPALVSVATLTSAVLIILVAGMASALIIVRRLRRLDLVAALKTRD
jgi:putative ABC transport system permease protein